VISVNISVIQLEQDSFIAMLAQILAETGLPAKTLRLEITESVVVQNNCDMQSRLAHLRGMGVQLYIDDFGKGYSSLSYLDTLPADAIKIDRSFVSNLGQSRANSGVVQAIIQMARELKIDVVAEGVETLEQQSELKRLHCGFVQGYYVSVPLETKDASRYIDRDRPGWAERSSL
jgi:EAL domain-containing protein (putative c-di-GMP-specific phosphodiesterase class I)